MRYAPANPYCICGVAVCLGTGKKKEEIIWMSEAYHVYDTFVLSRFPVCSRAASASFCLPSMPAALCIFIVAVYKALRGDRRPFGRVVPLGHV